MKILSRITCNSQVMGGKPCIRGMRVTVGTLVGLVASRYTDQQILVLYPYLEPEDIRAALAYAAWRSEEVELPILVA
ncbi:DUF433 domain-containing protein [Methylomicrobium sp. Wu6]|uniref:DUF433 domain-containing protein n=1 Tax=Methylomicrobium sp. Wu6 TaxID=3107928 RepID=UPI002DD68456|nr:DUF433 domain-containing protein [Methylomicrobium sp. Wu6]MEC4749821.1 DUF433 domain-containing protein [Methylomicrobium sp. Wu6]